MIGKGKSLTDCKVLIVDDHSLFREGLYRILKDAGIQTIHEACNGEEACILAKKFLPDIILMDLYMPGLNGIETTQQILASPPQATVVILTVNEGDDTIAEALRAGAQGFLNKNMRSKEIINALNQLLLGKIPLAKSLNRNILNHLTTPASKKNYRINGQEYSTRNPEITPREKEVLEAMARGMNNREIAAALYISENTVKNHVRNILDKMDVKSRTQAVAIWMTQGLID